MVVCGSVLDHLPEKWTGTVCGAGKLTEKQVDLTRARVLALRGPLTLATVNGGTGAALGDPALLMPDWIKPAKKEYELGVVPHWSDKGLRDKFPEAHYIDVGLHPESVIVEISRCERVISSSLHGLIIADAYGIPRQAELFPQAAQEGGDFKFRDYAANYGESPRFGETWTAPTEQVREIQQGLRRALGTLRSLCE